MAEFQHLHKPPQRFSCYKQKCENIISFLTQKALSHFIIGLYHILTPKSTFFQNIFQLVRLPSPASTKRNLFFTQILHSHRADFTENRYNNGSTTQALCGVIPEKCPCFHGAAIRSRNLWIFFPSLPCWAVWRSSCTA